MSELTWVEVSKSALESNMREFRKLVGPQVLLCPCVKANAYGHGLIEVGRIFLEAGADWLAVNSLYEAKTLREAGLDSPIYILGYVPLEDLGAAVALGCRLVVYNRETVKALGDLGEKAKVHIKVETGNNRQGVLVEELKDFAELVSSYPGLELEGLTSHFANIEDTTDHSYAESQLKNFKEAVRVLENAGIKVPVKHCANSAATILWPEAHFDLVRVGIAGYGMWPSSETYVSALQKGSAGLELSPAFCWKTKIAQVRTIGRREFVGYGCTYRTLRETRMAILPVGYYDGYDRGLSGSGAYVLIRGRRAPVLGRVCMNIIMVDVTDIPEASLEDEVVLMGTCGDEAISAEQFARWAGTINYEVTTRVNERVPRVIVEDGEKVK